MDWSPGHLRRWSDNPQAVWRRSSRSSQNKSKVVGKSKSRKKAVVRTGGLGGAGELEKQNADDQASLSCMIMVAIPGSSSPASFVTAA